MASIKARLQALEAMRPIQDGTEAARYERASYAARVLLGFLDSDPARGMVKRGISEDEARRFSVMGFHAAQRELRESYTERGRR